MEDISMISAQEQLKIIMKGVAEIVDEKELLDKLENSYASKKPLVVKLGLDPSAPDIHLGHAVVLRKIRQLQDLGHQVVIIIGDFTGKIGDPTGKTKGRSALSDKTVKENAKTYCDQVFKILDAEKTLIKFNSEWLSKLTLEELIQISSITTVARLLERNDFKNRYKNNVPIGLHEFFYPLMQAYDSIAIQADIELGGTDQTFNILMGRTLQKSMGKEQQIALFMPILEGLDGVEKMSKSLGNYIGIHEAPEVMFKKSMEIPDALILRYYELATDVHPDDIQKVRAALENGTNPRDIKLSLARTITSLYHDAKSVEYAEHYYHQAFAQKGIPDDIPVLPLKSSKSTLYDMIVDLVELGFVTSKNEFIRLVKQNAVRINDVVLSSKDLDNFVVAGSVLKIGKKRFIKFISP